jgi:hypothetical protein
MERDGRPSSLAPIVSLTFWCAIERTSLFSRVVMPAARSHVYRSDNRSDERRGQRLAVAVLSSLLFVSPLGILPVAHALLRDTMMSMLSVVVDERRRMSCAVQDVGAATTSRVRCMCVDVRPRHHRPRRVEVCRRDVLSRPVPCSVCACTPRSLSLSTAWLFIALGAVCVAQGCGAWLYSRVADSGWHRHRSVVAAIRSRLAHTRRR